MTELNPRSRGNEDRRVFRLHSEGLSDVAIADVVGMTPALVRSILRANPTMEYREVRIKVRRIFGVTMAMAVDNDRDVYLDFGITVGQAKRRLLKQIGALPVFPPKHTDRSKYR